jgi:hypothetical protein
MHDGISASDRDPDDTAQRGSAPSFLWYLHDKIIKIMNTFFSQVMLNLIVARSKQVFWMYVEWQTKQN